MVSSMQQHDDDHLVDGRRSIGSVTPPRRTCPAAGRAPDWLKHVDGRRRHPRRRRRHADEPETLRYAAPRRHKRADNFPRKNYSFSGRRRCSNSVVTCIQKAPAQGCRISQVTMLLSHTRCLVIAIRISF